MKRYCGLDVHKDSVFVCIMDENGIVFQEKFGVLTFELEKLRETLYNYATTDVCMESTGSIGFQSGEYWKIILILSW